MPRKISIRSVVASLILVLVVGVAGFGQSGATFPNERVYLHLNTSLLFPGDYLYYKCYVQRLDTKKLSDLSKVVYVELINEARSIVFQHKLFLEDGMMYGDFFIDQSLPSGNYKLVAFTHWMRNQGVASFFQQDISIINPYSNDQRQIWDIKNTPGDGNQETKSLGIAHTDSQENTPNPMTLTLSDTLFDIREQVQFQLQAFGQDAKNGHYSISIQRKPLAGQSPLMSPLELDQAFKYNKAPISPLEAMYTPELRGEILSGRVLQSNNNAPVGGTYVTMSSSMDPSVYRTSTTDADGVFYFAIDQPYEAGTLSLTPWDDATLMIEKTPKPKNDYSQMGFYQFKIDSSYASAILEKSIHNQIENAFASVKPDSVYPRAPHTLFDPRYLKSYDLDDFTRFNTLRQTIIEIVPEVGIKKNRNKEFLYVRTPMNILFEDRPTLVLLNGLVVENNTSLVGLRTEDVVNITVFKENFIDNGCYYKGALIIETKSADLANSFQENAHTTITVDIPQKEKKYFSPDYSSPIQKDNAVPDFRYQLLWQPLFSITDGKVDLEFFTSDVSGTFEISIAGFSQNGTPVSLKRSFTVQDNTIGSN